MLKRLTIFAVSVPLCLALFSIAQVPSSSTMTKSDGTSNSGRTSSADQKRQYTENQPANTVTTDYNGGHPAANNGAATLPNENIEIQRKLANYTEQLAKYTKYLFWAGIIQAAVLFLTLIAIFLQAVAAKDNAKAALKQANHMVKSERGWLFIDKGTERMADAIEDPYILPRDHQEVKPGNDASAHCVFYIRNVGKTPAKINTFSMEMQIGESFEYPPYPEVFEIGRPTFPPYFLPQGPAYPHTARLKTGYTTWKEFQSIKDRTACLWLCGIIGYEDVFSEKEVPHELCFCYLWETRVNADRPFWRVTDLPQYNRNT